MRRLSILLVVIASAAGPVAIVACKTKADVPTSMRHHDAIGLAIRDAIVRGDLPAARRNAAELEALPMRKGPPDFEERRSAMERASGAVAHAETLAAASTAVGTLVETCGDCHARFGGPTKVEVEPAPVAPRMDRHVWAMNQLWTGAITNSEPPWHAGANVLADPTLSTTELLPTKTPAPEVDALARAVHDLGVRSAAASDSGVRAKLYGELLVTCADCHNRHASKGVEP